MIGLAACSLSCYLVSSITIRSIEQNRLEESLEYKFSFEPFFSLDGKKKGGMRFTIFFCG